MLLIAAPMAKTNKPTINFLTMNLINSQTAYETTKIITRIANHAANLTIENRTRAIMAKMVVKMFICGLSLN